MTWIIPFGLLFLIVCCGLAIFFVSLDDLKNWIKFLAAFNKETIENMILTDCSWRIDFDSGTPNSVYLLLNNSPYARTLVIINLDKAFLENSLIKNEKKLALLNHIIKHTKDYSLHDHKNGECTAVVVGYATKFLYKFFIKPRINYFMKKLIIIHKNPTDIVSDILEEQ